MNDINKTFKVISNARIAAKTWRMVLEGDTSDLWAAGQFVNVALPGKFLRRPISVCDYDECTLTLLYDVVGSGTEQMSRYEEGDTFEILMGLGNGFSEVSPGSRPLLVGGGIGVAPLYNLAKKLISNGVTPSVVLGFNSECDVCLADEFETLGCAVFVSTADGSRGVKGFVTDAIRECDIDFDYYYACGPMPMLKALGTTIDIPGELSMESRMGCGFGACMCCSIQLKSGAARICVEGPVFKTSEIIWK